MKVLFLCKGNICRSPAAQAYLQVMRPDWLVESMATTGNTRGQYMHPSMRVVCAKFGIPTKDRLVKWIRDYDNVEEFFDVVVDLHREGISDPYLTGNFEQTLVEIIQFVDSHILDYPDGNK